MKAIFNFQFTIFKKLARSKKQEARSKKPEAGGFTLIELTVVMVLLLIVGTLIVGMLSSTIRGNAKSKITNDLGQNGNYALSVISDKILNSQNFKSITSAGNPPYTSCTPTGISGQSIVVTGFDGAESALACNGDTISVNGTSLLDTSKVKLESGMCNFTCVQADDYSAPRIDVTFKLINANGASSDSQGSATFNTSLSMRNKTLSE